MKQYEQISKIGEGSFGQVFKAKDKSNNLVAIKHIKFDSHQEGIPATALREISILKAISSHSSIIKLIEVHYEAMENQLMLVFEYYHCDLKRFIKQHKDSLSEVQIKKIMRQVLTGLAMLHDKKILHRDIKPQNIMLDEQDNSKIADFGLARYVTCQQKTLTREVETLWYRAPEVMLGMKQYTGAIDIWALGCIFGQLFLKRPIFLDSNHEIEQLLKVFEILGTPTKEQWPDMEKMPDFTTKFPKWKKQPFQTIIKNMPEQAISLLESMLQYDPGKRTTAFEALNHALIFMDLHQDYRVINTIIFSFYLKLQSIK